MFLATNFSDLHLSLEVALKAFLMGDPATDGPDNFQLDFNLLKI